MPPIIQVENLTYSYPGERTNVVSSLRFSVKEHEVIGIVGPSGCGKSTLLLALSGLIPHSISGSLSGKVLISGRNTINLSMAQLSQIVQLVFQSPESQLFALNVEDEITFGLENLHLPWKEIQSRLEHVLKLLDIEDLRRRSLEELSSGQKQRIALASVLAMKPRVLLFDEPTANLDPAAVQSLAQTISQLRKEHTVIIVEHNVEFLSKICDRLLLVEQGRLISQGSPVSMFRSKAYQQVMLAPHRTHQLIEKIKRIPTETVGKPILSIDCLSFSYPNGVRALSDIHLTIGKGDFVGIIGPNGSGKSTLALNLIGLLRGKAKITFQGRDITHLDVYERAKHIGYVFQNPNYQLFEETLDREIGFGPRNLGFSAGRVQKKVDEALHITNLVPLRDRDPHALSVGQKRRVSIASVLAMQPEIIILDEPDTGLDHKTAKHLMDYVKQLNNTGITIIMLSHSLELVVEYCNRVIAMKAGSVVPPSEILREYISR